MKNLETVVVEAQGEVQGTVIWLHGLGATGHDFEDIVPMLGCSHLRFVFPHAPSQPVTINGGMTMPSWYDIKTLDRGPGREDYSDVEKSARWVEALIQEELSRGVPANRLVLAGFSQGAAMTLHVGSRYPATFAGLMALSGYLLFPERLLGDAHSANAQTPTLICHGTQDPMVPFEGGQGSAQLLRESFEGREVIFKSYEMAHAVCPEEIQTIGDWLLEKLPAS